MCLLFLQGQGYDFIFVSHFTSVWNKIFLYVPGCCWIYDFSALASKFWYYRCVLPIFLFQFVYFFHFMYLGALPVCLSVSLPVNCVCLCPWWPVEGIWDCPKLEFQIVVSHFVHISRQAYFFYITEPNQPLKAKCGCKVSGYNTGDEDNGSISPTPQSHLKLLSLSKWTSYYEGWPSSLRERIQTSLCIMHVFC